MTVICGIGSQFRRKDRFSLKFYYKSICSFLNWYELLVCFPSVLPPLSPDKLHGIAPAAKRAADAERNVFLDRTGAEQAKRNIADDNGDGHAVNAKHGDQRQTA